LVKTVDYRFDLAPPRGAMGEKNSQIFGAIIVRCNFSKGVCDPFEIACFVRLTNYLYRILRKVSVTAR
jgi:hypothetical protein